MKPTEHIIVKQSNTANYLNQTAKLIIFVVMLCVSGLLSSASYADTDLPIVTGEVKKVKTDSGKITIRHDPIPNLDMPGMTMVFRTEEGVDISQLEKGDSVSFTVIEKNGKMFIQSITKSE